MRRAKGRQEGGGKEGGQGERAQETRQDKRLGGGPQKEREGEKESGVAKEFEDSLWRALGLFFQCCVRVYVCACVSCGCLRLCLCL